jgi:hypothetical protein
VTQQEANGSPCYPLVFTFAGAPSLREIYLFS